VQRAQRDGQRGGSSRGPRQQSQQGKEGQKAQDHARAGQDLGRRRARQASQDQHPQWAGESFNCGATSVEHEAVTRGQVGGVAVGDVRVVDLVGSNTQCQRKPGDAEKCEHQATDHFPGV
jgi:hypothetical protein